MRKFVNVEKYVSRVLNWKESLQQKVRTRLQAKRAELEQKAKLYAANYVNNLLREEIISQGKNPDAKPQPKTPEPTVADTFKKERPRFYNPFVPSWVRESFADPSKHIVRNPLPKPPQLHPLLDNSVEPVQLTAEETISIMNDDESRVQEIFDRVFGENKNVEPPAEPQKEDIMEVGTEAIQRLRDAISNIEIEMKLEDEDESVQVVSGSREIAAPKRAAISKKLARPVKVSFGKKTKKSTKKTKKPVKVKKFNKPVFRRVED